MIFRRYKPAFWNAATESSSNTTLFDYRRIWKLIILATSSVSTIPLLLMTFMHLNESEKAMYAETLAPVRIMTSNAKRTLNYFLNERKSALHFIVENNSYADLISQKKLARIFVDLNNSFGGFIDLGVIDSQGVHKDYVGPYELKDKDYSSQDWFKETLVGGEYVSNVFMGFRHVPHFVIAVKSQKPTGELFILRATIDTKQFAKLVTSLDLSKDSDAFILNRVGELQTPSWSGLPVLSKINFKIPPVSDFTEVIEVNDGHGNSKVVGYAYISDSPFIFMTVKEPLAMLKSWTRLRNTQLTILAFSIFIILAVNLAVVTFLVNRVYTADMNRSATLHKVEHTSKMASIGRLAAGVAHEINNPLAIINEKAGLIKDLITYSKQYEKDERLLKMVNSIISSVTRCSNITHRLLGFAKHIDVHVEAISLPMLIGEVLSFLEKEAEYREIKVNVQHPDNIADVMSDRGQLQQVFLNLINNAFAAVQDGGQIDITLTTPDPARVKVSVKDNGCGISPENLKRIFDPFFSTKTNQGGTGLGLSITYGIVRKLGGQVNVSSTIGSGTEFLITLPVKG